MSPGAHPGPSGTTFVAWTTVAREVSVRLFDPAGEATRTVPLEARGDGLFAKDVPGVFPGALYKLVLDGEEVPDPYARFMPQGVHGPAEVWAKGKETALAAPPPRENVSLYEVHVGTFSPEGTFRGVEARLDAIAELGVTTLELLPVASFAGARGWGYDGVALYAPYERYGTPDDLRALVRAAHARGLGVVLDVVYNHFGPAGNYLWKYSPAYFTPAVKTPWGPAPDFGHAPMRGLVMDNVRYWLEEFGFDGLRLDAVHAIHDATSAVHVLREITDLSHGMSPPRAIYFEDERNDPASVTALGADGVWADDFHHHLHVVLTSEQDGYYRAYERDVAGLARAINEGWSFTGEPYAPWDGRPRGKAVRGAGVLPHRLVYCIQNHDQVGNRALGTRLSHLVDMDSYAAASMLLLFLPAVPLLFMGQEWASKAPFLFFSDHDSELGEAVRKGRREEFATFAAFANPEERAKIPDPQAEETFLRSKLDWESREAPAHAAVLGLYRAMLDLRRHDEVLGAKASWEDVEATARGPLLEVVRRHGGRERCLLVNLGNEARPSSSPSGATVLLSSRPSAFESGVLAAHSAVLLALAR